MIRHDTHPFPFYSLALKAQISPDGYKIISSDELRATMDELVSEISSLLDLNNYASAALLRFFRWNKEKVIDAYCAEPEETRKKAGIAQFVTDFKRTTAKIPCDICRDPTDTSELIALGCEHYFHKTCFAEYLVKKVSSMVVVVVQVVSVAWISVSCGGSSS